MGPLLIDRWLGAIERIRILDEASVSEARLRVASEGSAAGLSDVAVAALATAASELGHNQLRHARGGEIGVRRVARRGISGVEVIAADRGGGIRDPIAAVEGRGGSSSLGAGLSGVLRLCDEVDFDVRQGEGTCVWARKFAESVGRRREVAILGRPAGGEQTSGDDGAHAWIDGGLLAAVADGLGHGPEARVGSARAMEVVRARPRASVDETLRACDAALADVRGATLAIARVDDARGIVECGRVGDASLHLYRPHESRRCTGVPGAVGEMAKRRRRMTSEEIPARPGDLLVLFTDGLTTRVDLSEDLDLQRREPLVIAARLVERYERPNDDVLVLVAR